MIEAKKTIVALQQEIDDLYLKLMDKEGQVENIKKESEDKNDAEVQTE